MKTDPQVSQGALDLRLGMIALDKEFITPAQLQEAMAEQARDTGTGKKPVRPLAAILVAKGFLNDEAIEVLLQAGQPQAADLEERRRQDQRLAALLLKEGVPQEVLDDCIATQEEWMARHREAPRLAEVLVEKGFVAAEDISRILARTNMVMRCGPCGKRYNVTNCNPLKTHQCPRCRAILEPTGEEYRRTAANWPAVQQPLPSKELKSLGRFRLVRVLGQGGMGVVYEAIDTQLHRRVALKTMLASEHASPEEIKLEEERFIRESRLSASLNHPNIVTVYEAGVLEGRRYLAMELIEGKPLLDWRKQGSITIRQQVSILRDVALAVHEAHMKGVLHRDLKPANILVDARNRPHVMDFGLAKVTGKHSSISLTASGALVGTPAYMSPEQAKCVRTIDRRTDIWSLGVMLYETLAGHQPFEGETAVQVLMKVIQKPVPKLARQAGMDATIEGVCMKALAKNPKERYSNAALLANDLARWLKGERFRAAPAP